LQRCLLASAGHQFFADYPPIRTVRVVVENMTDVATDAFVFDVPFGGGNFAKILEPQRLVFAEAQYHF